MIIQLLLQLFFAQNIQNLENMDNQQTSIAIAANQDQREVVQGYDEATDLTYFHTLPRINDENQFGPQRINADSLGVIPTADSVFVADERTWTVLFEKQSQTKRPIASISKLMTALVLLDLNIDFEQNTTVYKSDYREGGIVNIFEGEIISNHDLWMDALVSSDNVAIITLVRQTGLSLDEFVAKMNLKARELGLNDTDFVEPTGISSNNISTAVDVAKMVHKALQRPEIKDAVRQPVYSFQPINSTFVRNIENTNKLLKSYLNIEPYAFLGGKTGFIYEAGYCMAGMVQGPPQTDDIIVVILGSDTEEDRFTDFKGVTDWVFNNFKW